MNDNIWGKIGSFLIRAVIAVFGKKEEAGGVVELEEDGKIEKELLIAFHSKDGLSVTNDVREVENAGYIAMVPRRDGEGLLSSVHWVILLSGGRIYGSPRDNGSPRYHRWTKLAGWTGDEVLLDSVPDGGPASMTEGGVITRGNPDSVFGTSSGNWKADEVPKDHKDEVVTNETISR